MRGRYVVGVARYVAFLGGINVGGHRVTMDRLRAEFEALGFTDVRTFIASGNVLFEATGSRASLESKIEARLAEQLGYAVPTFVRTASRCGKPRRSNRTERSPTATRTTSLFLRKAPTAAAKRATEALSNDQDRFEVHGTELHWHIHGGLTDSSVKPSVLAKALGRPSTARNTKSLRKLSDMLAKGCQTHLMSQVMNGIRILEVAEHTFVPAASAILSDWGAEVIKIEHVERGDAMRGLMHRADSQVRGTGRCTCDRALEPRQEEPCPRPRRPPRAARSCTGSRRAATCSSPTRCRASASELKIDVDDIRAHNPDIVYVRGSGYGAAGPTPTRGATTSSASGTASGVADEREPLDARRLPSQPGTRVRRLDRRHDHRRRDLRRAAPPRAHRRGAVVDVSLLATGMWAMGERDRAVRSAG